MPPAGVFNAEQVLKTWKVVLIDEIPGLCLFLLLTMHSKHIIHMEQHELGSLGMWKNLPGPHKTLLMVAS